MNWNDKLRNIVEKIGRRAERIMYGRNGLDFLNTFLTIVYAALVISGAVIPNRYISVILWITSFVVAFLFIFRGFSKNLAKRREENEKFYSVKLKTEKSFRLVKNKWRDRKTHIYRKCPNCGATLRLKKIKGTHTCNCPHCKTEIKVKVH